MKLAALGDLFLGDQLACVGFGVRSYCDQNGYDHLFEGVRSTLQGYDLVIANLETVLSQASDADRNHSILSSIAAIRVRPLPSNPAAFTF